MQSVALPVEEKEGHGEGGEEGDAESHKGGDEDDFVDFTTKILTSNNNTDKFLLEGDLVAPTNRNAMKCWYNSCFWSKASNGLVMIPYVIDSEYSPWEVATIEGAMGAFSDRTCIPLCPGAPMSTTSSALSAEMDATLSWAEREDNRSCLSTGEVACIAASSNTSSTTALGFQHEHTRSDRDSYVQINWQNIIPASAYNFNKHDTNNLNTPYDYSSIMHYGRDAFSIAYGLDTITPIPDPNVPIGQRNGMSRLGHHQNQHPLQLQNMERGKGVG
ncbi:High choriolytic enzyme 2 [Oryzias melastigma]|uniref:Metalloendopeptidase n=1 Tax=Oryzias melastigma TaxID=30732 RepID=A0A834C7K9_ORYME|nr:High choriolytic enzyme 2 [Oryzias melastigma]